MSFSSLQVKRKAIVFAFVVLCFSTVAFPAIAVEYMIITANSVETFDSFPISDVEYFDSSHLKVLGIDVSVEGEEKKVIIQSSSADMVISPSRKVVAIGDELITLSAVPSFVGDNIFLPLSYMAELIPRLVGSGSFRFGPSDELMVSIDVHINCEKDVFKLSLPVGREYEKENKNLCLVLFFPGTRINPIFEGELRNSSAISRISHESSRFGDRIYFYYRNVGTKFYNVGDISGDGGKEIIISFVEKKKLPSHDASKNGEDRGIVVVLDPGHGGEAIGAIGPGGLYEKDAVLELCRELKTLLENNLAVKVILTRDSDMDISLDERTELANEVKADLFISVHANGSRRHDAQGAETYFLSYEATDDNARNLAAVENYSRNNASAPNLPEKSGLNLVLWDLAQSQFLEESSNLAETIQQNLNSYLGVRNRGIKQAPFKVLKGATMPAVLVEIGFITNPEEERKLRQVEYRRRICDALYSSISSFKELKERKQESNFSSPFENEQ